MVVDDEARVHEDKGDLENYIDSSLLVACCELFFRYAIQLGVGISIIFIITISTVVFRDRFQKETRRNHLPHQGENFSFSFCDLLFGPPSRRRSLIILILAFFKVFHYEKKKKKTGWRFCILPSATTLRFS